MKREDLEQQIKSILETLSPNVLLVAAAKTRTATEVRASIEAGITAVGHNYVNEAEEMRHALANWLDGGTKRRVHWHLIGHLQRNKAKRAVELFDMIETIDSLRIAQAVNRHCAAVGKIMPVLIEINSGQESSKTGVLPHEAKELVREIAELPNIRMQGLMTMGPRFGNPEEARPYFRLTKKLFDQMAREEIQNVEMHYLSMGMSNSYKVAIEEGANIVRIGTKLFGLRNEG